MNYDDWKLETPEDGSYKECNFCGNIIDEDKSYCSRECYIADNDEDC